MLFYILQIIIGYHTEDYHSRIYTLIIPLSRQGIVTFVLHLTSIKIL